MYNGTMTVTIRRKQVEFRDIRGDLRARIKSLEETSEREQAEFIKKQEEATAEHRKSMDAIKGALAGYRRMLELEESLAEHNMLDTENKMGPSLAEVKIPVPASRIPLYEFFIAELKEKGPLSKDELREAAQRAGYFSAGDGGGRATHATLANITRSKRVVVGDDGKFSVSPIEALL